MEKKASLASLILRIGLAATLLFAGISSLLFPNNWIWFIPSWMQAIMPANLLLLGHGIFEIILGLWLLSGWKSYFAAIIYALDMLVIILSNVTALDVIFRDVGLLATAIALVILTKSTPNPTKQTQV